MLVSGASFMFVQYLLTANGPRPVTYTIGTVAVWRLSKSVPLTQVVVLAASMQKDRAVVRYISKVIVRYKV